MSVHGYRDYMCLLYYVIFHRKVNFSDIDDYHLSRYLATTIPNKQDGGRAGNTLYKELEKLVRILHISVVLNPADAFTLCYHPLTMIGRSVPRGVGLGKTTSLAILAKSIQ